jgi:hypothetical protein
MTSSNFNPARFSQPFAAAFTGTAQSVPPQPSAAARDDAWVREQADLQVGGANIAAIVRQRRRVRLLRFAICEALAVALTITFAWAGVSSRYLDETLTSLFRFLPIASAAVATILPILFFGSPQRRVPRVRLR